MQLVKHIKHWYEQVPEECKRYVTQQMAFLFPGLPSTLRELDIDAVPLLIQNMEFDGENVNIGFVVSFVACMDYVLYEYDNLDRFLEQIEWDKKLEAQLNLRQSFESENRIRQRIDNATAEFAARRHASESWQTLKTHFLNNDYFKQYSLFQLQQSIKQMNCSLWNNINKNL